MLIFALALVGCGDDVVEGAWRRLDLYHLPAGVLSPVAERPTPLQGELSTLGERTLLALAPQPGETLVWRLDLLDEARFMTRAVAEGGRCRFRVRLRDAEGRDHELASWVTSPFDLALPAVTTVDLAAFARQRVLFGLDVADASADVDAGDASDAGAQAACVQARWGSPVIVHRGTAPSPRRGGPPNVVLIGADTLRADALGVYGREPSVTPTLDALAAESDVWLEAYASSNNTNPSFTSLMTGLYAKNHGVYDLVSRLPASYLTLAEILRDAGYRTWGATAATHLGWTSGLDQGFELFAGPLGQYFGETVVDNGLTWLEQPRDQPFFLWLHFFDPHVPHNPPAPYHLGRRPARRYGLARVEEWVSFREPGARAFDPRAKLPGHVDLYLGEVAYLDRQIDRLLDFLDSRRLLETTIVVFVGDHGETLGERGSYFDHVGLFDNTTRVPLMIRWPGQSEGRRLGGLAQHLDVFPTLLRHLGLEVPEQDGVDLLELEDRGRRQVFAQHAENSGAMVRRGRFKYLFNRASPFYPEGPYLFDLDADPNEEQNLAGRNHPMETELATLLDRWLQDRRPGEAPEPVVIDDEQRRRLEALGYLR